MLASCVSRLSARHKNRSRSSADRSQPCESMKTSTRLAIQRTSPRADSTTLLKPIKGRVNAYRVQEPGKGLNVDRRKTPAGRECNETTGVVEAERVAVQSAALHLEINPTKRRRGCRYAFREPPLSRAVRSSTSREGMHADAR